MKRVDEWCKKTSDIYGKRAETLTVTIEPMSEFKEDTKYMCAKCKRIGPLNMILSCGSHQLCFICATEIYHEKIWTSGGLEIDSRIECDDCNKTAVVSKMLLKECRCIIDCVSMRDLHKVPYEFGKKGHQKT